MGVSLEKLTREEAEKALEQARLNGNFLRYKRLCDVLQIGQEAGYEEYYALGVAEELYWKEIASKEEKKNKPEELKRKIKIVSQANKEKYRNFFEETQKLRINTRSFIADYDRKAELLIRYFPGFGENGKNSIIGWPARRLGGLFNGMLKTSKKYYRQ